MLSVSLNNNTAFRTCMSRRMALQSSIMTESFCPGARSVDRNLPPKTRVMGDSVFFIWTVEMNNENMSINDALPFWLLRSGSVYQLQATHHLEAEYPPLSPLSKCELSSSEGLSIEGWIAVPPPGYLDKIQGILPHPLDVRPTMFDIR